jgi:predicted pyridoxine 5'-phosphate oxidase superfamily flavin-nucleotide-binding protein
MANLSKYKDLIEKGMVYIATSDKKCKPNVICITGCRLVAKDTICATDNMMDKTRKNIKQNNKIALIVGKGEKWYQFKGTVAYHPSGKWFKFVKTFPSNKPFDPQAAVLMKVKEVYDLWEGEQLV